MKSKSTLLGVLLIVLGSFWFLDNFGFLEFLNIKQYLYSLINLWPLFLVIFGTFLVTRKKSIRILTIVISVVIWFLYVFTGPNMIEGLQRLITQGHL